MDPISLIVLGLIGYVLLTSTNSAAAANANGQSTTNSLLAKLLEGSSSGKKGSSAGNQPKAGDAAPSGPGGYGSGVPTSLQDLNYDEQSPGIQALIDAQNNPLNDVTPTSSDTSDLGLISGDSSPTYDQPGIQVPDSSDYTGGGEYSYDDSYDGFEGQ